MWARTYTPKSQRIFAWVNIHTRLSTDLPLGVAVLELHRGHELVLDAVLQLEDGELPPGGGHLFVGLIETFVLVWLVGCVGADARTYARVSTQPTPTTHTMINTTHTRPSTQNHTPKTDTHTRPSTPSHISHLLERLEVALRIGLHDGDLELDGLHVRVRDPVVHLLMCVLTLMGVCGCVCVGDRPHSSHPNLLIHPYPRSHTIHTLMYTAHHPPSTCASMETGKREEGCCVRVCVWREMCQSCSCECDPPDLRTHAIDTHHGVEIQPRLLRLLLGLLLQLLDELHWVGRRHRQRGHLAGRLFWCMC